MTQAQIAPIDLLRERIHDDIDGVFWMYGGCCAVAAIGLTIMGSVLGSTNAQNR